MNSLLGSSVKWEYNSPEKTLRISGHGEMPAFNQNEETGAFDNNPWKHIKDEAETLIIDEGVVSVSGAAFWGFSCLKYAVIPYVMQISPGAFYECHSLEEVAVSRVTTIGDSAFARCFSLQRIAPKLSPSSKRNVDSLIFIDERAFSCCHNLESVLFGNLKALGKGAFFDCPALKSVSCEKLALISEYAFRDCSGLEICRVQKGCNFPDNAFDKALISHPSRYVDKA